MVLFQVVESGPLRASVKITVPLVEHGDLTLIATVVTETPYVSFKADVSPALLSLKHLTVSELYNFTCLTRKF